MSRVSVLFRTPTRRPKRLVCALLLARVCEREHGASLPAVADAAVAKLRRRAPYVFGGPPATTLEEAERQWLDGKAAEKASRHAREQEELEEEAAEEAAAEAEARERRQAEARAAKEREFAKERAKLEAIRDAMIEDMLKRGYNPNYLNEIRNCDIQKIQMR